jgi:hypothetical protein
MAVTCTEAQHSKQKSDETKSDCGQILMNKNNESEETFRVHAKTKTPSWQNMRTASSNRFRCGCRSIRNKAAEWLRYRSGRCPIEWPKYRGAECELAHRPIPIDRETELQWEWSLVCINSKMIDSCLVAFLIKVITTPYQNNEWNYCKNQRKNLNHVFVLGVMRLCVSNTMWWKAFAVKGLSI